MAVSILVLVVAVLGSGVYLRIRGAEDDSEADADELLRPVVSAVAEFPADVANPVRGAPVIRDTLVVSVGAAAQSSSFQSAEVFSRVQGPVREVRVRENDWVDAGVVVAVVDPVELELALERAELELNAAQARYVEETLFLDRTQDPDIRAEQERNARLRSGLEQAELRMREARLELERTEIRAPFAGRVANLKVVEGQWLRAGDEVLTVIRLDPIRVDAKVLETDIVHLTPGRGARVEFSAFPGERFTGRIESINPVVEDTRTARVTLSVPNPDGRIIAGMYAEVSLEARRYPDRILVPVQAVLERDRSPVVFVYQPGERGAVAMWRYIRLGLRNDEHYEVLHFPGEERSDPLEPGEVVLVDGHYTLTHQASVRLVEDVRAEGGRPH